MPEKHILGTFCNYRNLRRKFQNIGIRLCKLQSGKNRTRAEKQLEWLNCNLKETAKVMRANSVAGIMRRGRI